MHIRTLLPLFLLSSIHCGDGEAGTFGTQTTDVDPSTTDDLPTTSVDPTTGGQIPCVTISDCAAAAPPCAQAVACTAGACEFDDLPEGTALPDQSAGDCAEEVCDGAGGSKLVPVDDPPDDGVLCTLDTCDGLVSQHTPGMAPCYSGPANTADVGQCTPGTQACDEDGVPQGPCVGEVLPADEQCDAALADEDCDGAVNESGRACACAPGSVLPCYTGPNGTADVGACLAGQQVCDPDGLGLGACMGEVLPADEDCDGAMVDEDCDGAINESGPSCTCGDGFLSVGEECDDGNQVDRDGCSATCTGPAQAISVADGYYHTCAVLANHRVKCWGDGYVGATGHGDSKKTGDEPGEMGDALPYTDLGADFHAQSIVAGEHHTCALSTTGRVKCWGANADGQLGLGDELNRGFSAPQLGDALPYLDLGAGKLVVSLTAGRRHTCAVLTGGTLKCWGDGGNGNLGNESNQDLADTPDETGDGLPAVDLGTGRIALAVDAGELHTCAVLDDHTIKCWGANPEGCLGLENSKDGYGQVAGSMGDNLPTVMLGTGRTALAVSAGARHTCALLDGGDVKCWGSPDHGSLGLEYPGGHGAFTDSMGDNLPVVDLGAGEQAVAISSGQWRNCVLLAGGEVKCWGKYFLGIDGQDIGDAPGEMGDNLPAIDLGTGASASVVSADSGGSFQTIQHTCVVIVGGALKCWGINDVGELGKGDTVDVGNSKSDMGDNLLPIDL